MVLDTGVKVVEIVILGYNNRSLQCETLKTWNFLRQSNKGCLLTCAWLILNNFPKVFHCCCYSLSRPEFSRFLDLRGNLGIVQEKLTRKTCFSREKKRLAPRIYQAKFCLAMFL